MSNFLHRITVWLLNNIYKFYSFTYRISYVNSEVIQKFQSEGKSCILVHWHEDDLSLIGPHRYRNYCVLISHSRDGDILAHVMSKLGYSVVRGSSSKGGARGLIQLIRKAKSGSNVIVTVDGPRGPRHIVKPGAILLSQKSKQPIITVAAVAAKRYVFRKSWSQTYLPAPFSRVIIGYGGPIDPPKSGDASNLEKTQREVQENLINLHKLLELSLEQ
ncbi:lysophospholipid acyltransferase family protein [bacterium]|nr:lysophospholipid acyltransferase family protein [candidate division CSSED10-310 bacterium]